MSALCWNFVFGYVVGFVVCGCMSLLIWLLVP